MLPAERLVRADGALRHWSGRRVALEKSLADMTRDVSLAKRRLNLRADVEQVLLALQEQSHRKTVGMYEDLLSQILQEVLPNESKRVAVDLTVVNGVPSADFVVARTPDGKREDILTGNGGSVANVISAGLRFIALSSTNLRKFIILDEADCWLAPARVPAFSNVISNMGADLGVQSLVISHHETEMFADASSSIISLSKGAFGANGDWDPRVIARVIAAGDSPSTEQISYIQLIDFMSHKDTVIPLSAGMTALIGDNDVGKSAVVVGFGVASGLRTFKKEFVHHGATKSVVRIGFGDGSVVETVRNAEGSPAIICRLLSVTGDLLHESPTGNPDWLSDATGIRLENGLDIQIGNQKRPVFLLDEPGSRQASILSIGKEAGLISDMQSEYKTRVASDRKFVKQSEPDVAALRVTIGYLRDLDTCAELLELAHGAYTRASNLEKEIIELSAVITRLVGCSEAVISLADAVVVMPELEATDMVRDGTILVSELLIHTIIPETPTVTPVDDMVKTIAGIVYAKPISDQVVPSVPLIIPVLARTRELSAIVTSMSKNEPFTTYVVPEYTPDVPVLVSPGSMGRLVKALLAVLPNEGVLPNEISAPPKVLDTKRLGELIDGLARNAVSNLPRLPRVPVAPTGVVTISGGLSLSKSLDQLAVEQKKLEADLILESGDIVATELALDKMIEEAGGICPLCNGTLGGIHGH